MLAANMARFTFLLTTLITLWLMPAQAQGEEQLLEDEEIDLDMDLDLNDAPPLHSAFVLRKDVDIKLEGICADLCSRRPPQREPWEGFAGSPILVTPPWVPASYIERTQRLIDDGLVQIKRETEVDLVGVLLERCPPCEADSIRVEKDFEARMQPIREGERDSVIVSDMVYLAFRLRRDDAIVELTPVVLDEMKPTPYMIRRLIHATDSLEAKIALFDRAIAMAETQDERVALLYQKAAQYQLHGRMASARDVAEEVLELDEDHGPSLVLIGDYWASIAGSGSIAAASPVWVALDFYNRAASRDPDRATYARQNAAAYSRYFPCREDAFLEGLRDGQAYTTPQGARTTVRLRDC